MLSARDIELRRRSLGASEIGIIAGHSLYLDRTLFGVWEAKVFGETFVPTPEMRAGALMEPGIAKLYLERIAEDVRLHRGRRRVHRTERWMSATPDYFVIDSSGAVRRLLECKWVGLGQESHWDVTDAAGVPDMYVDQAMWQMDVTGVPEIDVVAFFAASRQIVFWRFRRDAGRIAELVSVGRDFWFGHVVTGVRPPLDESSAATRYLSRILHDPDSVIQAPVEAEALARRYDELSSELRAAKKERDQVRNLIADIIGDHAAMVAPWGGATFREQSRGPNYRDVAEDVAALAREAGVSAEQIEAVFKRHTSKGRTLRVTYKET